MKQYSRNELYEFVWRANDAQKINLAAEWLKLHVQDNDLYDDLMIELTRRYQMINAQTLQDGSSVWF